MKYEDREEMKRVGYQYNIPDLVICSHWVRSRVSADDDRHPDFGEYKKAYLSGGKEWLPKGKSYVDMQYYLRDNPDRKEEKRIREQTYINKIEKLKQEKKELRNQIKDLKETNNKLQNENSYLKEDLTDIRIKFRKLTRQKEDEEYIENMPRLLICDCCLKPTKGDESVYFVNTGRRICFDCFSGAIKSEVKKSEEAKERKK